MTPNASQTDSVRTPATPNASSAKLLYLEMPEPRFESIFPQDRDGSSPDEQQDGTPLLEEDANSVVGVSISRAQTRLMSPQTPAAEKAAALGGLNGAGMFDGAADNNEHGQEDDDVNGEPRTPRHSSEEPFTSTKEQHSIALPSPWRAEPRPFERIKTHGQDHQEMEPTSILSDLNIRRYFSSFNLPSLSKTPIFRDISVPSLSSILSSTRSRSPIQRAATRQKRANTVADTQSGLGFGTRTERWSGRDPAIGQNGIVPHLSSNGNGHREPHSNTPHCPSPSMRGRRASSDTTPMSPHGSRLHRSTSDQSLMLRRATSTGSSLGDDSRWENVQDQVNSRMKAIKDSLQDSSIKLPRMPNVSSLNLDAFRPDFTKPRAHSEIKGPLRNTYGEATVYDRAYAMQGGTGPQGLQLLGMNATTTDRKPKSTHPYLEQALEHLTGDLVVMGGYRGSILRSTKPPNRQLWVPIKVGLNIRKVDLEVGLQPEDEENMEDHIYASGMLSHIGPVDMGRRLLKRLRACKNAQDGTLRVHDYGYDWRLSPHLLSRRLIEFLERLPCNAGGVPDHERGVTILAHSMGGLITRHSVNQRPELFKGVVFAGVPQHCVNILGPLRNGDEVLLSSNVLTAQVNFTLRSSFLLLPEDGKCFINKVTKEDYRVNFFNVEHWKQYAWSPCIAPALPPAHPPENKSLLGSMADMLPSFPSFALPGRKSSVSRSRDDKSTLADAANAASTRINDFANASYARSLDPQLGSSSSSPHHGNGPQSTIPLPNALAYLKRTLDQTIAFKSEMAHIAGHTFNNRYPPLAILYANNTPTVVAARVASRDGIRRADAYDDLQFASGDGVCLARAAMLPPGYLCTKGGKVKTERGHVGLLGDLEAVGKLLAAVIEGRRKGTGLGMEMEMERIDGWSAL
ncbi:MAG: hypothetical protein ASARMPRED_008646 [Alectoria sarmentosa]|nr:MAG: hypothetical protein ASARMPRED_008646 [Alectoria sarmentosa]